MTGLTKKTCNIALYLLELEKSRVILLRATTMEVYLSFSSALGLSGAILLELSLFKKFEQVRISKEF